VVNVSSVPQQYVPQDGRLFTVSMGLRALDEALWLEIDERYSHDIALKKELYERQLPQVFQATEAGLPGSVETYDMICQHLAQHFPDLELEPSNDNSARVELAVSEHPLLRASLLVQEDLCVMTKVEQHWVLTAASVCFPSRWDLTQKIGTNLHEIHAPVPHYEERIGAATDAMFDKFTSERPVWRINWTILDKPELYQPASTHESTLSSDEQNQQAESNKLVDSENFADATFLRIERQTLRVLPQTNDVLFTIRTYVDSLTHVANTYPQFKEQLAATLEGVSGDTKTYKGWDAMWNDLIRWSAQD
jgi:hypothetical protein